MEALTAQTGSEYGVIIRVRDVFPDIVDQSPKTLLVDYKQFVPLLIEAIKELYRNCYTERES